MKKLSFRDPLSEVFLNEEDIFRKINFNKQLFFSELFKKDFFTEMNKKAGFKILKL